MNHPPPTKEIFYISLAELTAVGPVQHPESDILAAEADPARLKVQPQTFIIHVVALQLSLGLLDPDVTELEEAEPDPSSVQCVLPGVCTSRSPSHCAAERPP